MKPVQLALVFMLSLALVSVARSSDEPIGVAECDQYISNYRACLASMAPDSKAAMEKAFAQTQDAWRKAAATQDGRDGLRKACATAMEAIKPTCADVAKAPASQPLINALKSDASVLGGIQLGWRISDLTNEVATKETTEQLNPTAKGIRSFDVLPTSTPSGVDRVRVLAKDGKVAAVFADSFLRLTSDNRNTGSYSALVTEVTMRHGQGRVPRIDDNLKALLYGKRGRSVVIYEMMTWQTPAGSVLLAFARDDVENSRWYTLATFGKD